FWALIRHFLYDLFHFDGKFFDTVKNLLTKPGIIAMEYTHGKRTKYLDPVRMYLFTSAVFFLVFFTTQLRHTSLGEDYLTPVERMQIASGINTQLKANPSDSGLKKKMNQLLDTSYRLS